MTFHFNDSERKIILQKYWKNENYPKILVKPAIEDGVADTGAHGDNMAQTKDEEISLQNTK